MPASFSTTGIAISTGGISAGQRGAFAGTGGDERAHLRPPSREVRRVQVVGHGVRVDVVGVLDAFDVGDVMVRQLAGPREVHATCRKRKHIRYEPSGMHR